MFMASNPLPLPGTPQIELLASLLADFPPIPEVLISCGVNPEDPALAGLISTLSPSPTQKVVIVGKGKLRDIYPGLYYILSLFNHDTLWTITVLLVFVLCGREHQHLYPCGVDPNPLLLSHGQRPRRIPGADAGGLGACPDYPGSPRKLGLFSPVKDESLPVTEVYLLSHVQCV